MGKVKPRLTPDSPAPATKARRVRVKNQICSLHAGEARYKLVTRRMRLLIKAVRDRRLGETWDRPCWDRHELESFNGWHQAGFLLVRNVGFLH